MERKDRLDSFGVISLVGFAALLGFNQIVIKVVNEGLQPVFFAALRSAGAAPLVWAAMVALGRPPRIAPGTAGAGVLIGAVFAFEFIFLFLALDLTTVGRTSVIFYSMPVWLALAAHVLLPGERLTRAKLAGLALAMAGVGWAILDRPGAAGGAASLAGDLFALLAAMGWAGVALCARGTALREVAPEMQLLWQLAVSAPILLIAALFFGPFVRAFEPWHLWGLGFQVVGMACLGFLFWFWLLKIYPAASVAAFSFLAPIFGVGFGWALLGEQIGPSLLGALALVAAGLWLINRPAARAPAA